MKVTFRELDFWMAKGFGGVLNILAVRVGQFKHGFAKVVRQLIAKEVQRMNELNDAVQSREEDASKITTDLKCIDNWFVKGFEGMDRYLKERADEGEVPIDPNILHSMQEHVNRLQRIIDTEKAKCGGSTGKSAA